ncbi:unnamed protein product [Ixodes pacificus]
MRSSSAARAMQCHAQVMQMDKQHCHVHAKQGENKCLHSIQSECACKAAQIHQHVLTGPRHTEQCHLIYTYCNTQRDSPPKFKRKWGENKEWANFRCAITKS